RRPVLAVIPVNVDVDQAGRDVQPRGIDGFGGLRRRDVRGNGGDLAVLDGDVANGINPVPAVDDVAALEEQVVRRLSAREARNTQRQQKHAGTLHRGLLHFSAIISAWSGCQGRIAGARTGRPGVTPSTARPLVTTATPLTST